jgi:hypothetical protein
MNSVMLVPVDRSNQISHPQKTIGGYLNTVDYCPIFVPIKFGSNILLDCTNETIQEKYEDALGLFSYESFGPDARCYLSSKFRSLCCK